MLPVGAKKRGQRAKRGSETNVAGSDSINAVWLSFHAKCLWPGRCRPPAASPACRVATNEAHWTTSRRYNSDSSSSSSSSQFEYKAAGGCHLSQRGCRCDNINMATGRRGKYGLQAPAATCLLAQRRRQMSDWQPNSTFKVTSSSHRAKLIQNSNHQCRHKQPRKHQCCSPISSLLSTSQTRDFLLNFNPADLFASGAPITRTVTIMKNTHPLSFIGRTN